jgi:hypothetical protein
MWEVLAPIVRWPLYSPARFAAVVIGALVAVLIAGEINDGSGPHATTSRPAPSIVVPQHSTPPPSTGSATASSGDASAATEQLSVDPADGNPSAAAADTAAAFVAAWARPDLDADEWTAGVRPLVTTELWSTGLSMTDPASTPAVTVRGEPRQVGMNAEEAVFDVPTSGARVRIHLTRGADEGAWLVSGVEPVR